MRPPRPNRLRGALLWVVVAGLWLAMYPGFFLSMREFALVLLALFFIYGVQNFEREPGELGMFLKSPEIPVAHSAFANWWLKYRTLVFLCCANLCIALIAASRILRIWKAGLIR